MTDIAKYPRRNRRRPFRELLGNTSGLAMVEFAMTLPLFIGLGLSGAEMANYAIAHLRVSQIALAVADNAGRIRTSIDEADIEEMMIGVDLMGQGINFSQNGRLILSSLEPNGLTGADAGQWIRWQRCFGARTVASSYGVQGDGQTNDDLEDGMGPTGRKITSLSNTAVMFVEVSYNYQPITVTALWGPRTINYTAAYTVRERTDQAMRNAGSIATADLRTCNYFRLFD